MPSYQYSCNNPKCKFTKDVLHSYSELTSPSQETLSEIQCPKHGLMVREFTTPHLANMKGGISVTEKELLRDKQASLKTKARSATAQSIETDVKDPQDKARLKAKYSSKQFKDLKDNPYAKKKK